MFERRASILAWLACRRAPLIPTSVIETNCRLTSVLWLGGQDVVPFTQMDIPSIYIAAYCGSDHITNPLKGFILSSILQSAAHTVQLLCDATRIFLDPPQFNDAYVSFPLKHWHGIEGDFFIRAQSVGITLKGEDLNLFYLLQNELQYEDIKLEVRRNKIITKLEPVFSGEGNFSVDNPCTFYLASISSGNLKDISDIRINRDPGSFNERADFLASLLFTQWIVKMMPYIEHYVKYKRLKLLAPVKRCEAEAKN